MILILYDIYIYIFIANFILNFYAQTNMKNTKIEESILEIDINRIIDIWKYPLKFIY